MISYDLAGIMKLRRKMRESLLTDYVRQSLEGQDFREFVSDMGRYLPSTVEYVHLLKSLEHLAGVEITKDVLDEVCWRMAGNVLLLREQAVVPWHKQRAEEWVPVQFIDASRQRSGRKKKGWLFTFQVLAGTPCPVKVQQFWTDRFCGRMAHELGFQWMPSDKSNQVPRAVYQFPTEFLTLRMTICIEPKLCTGEGPGFERTGLPGYLRNWNREQMKYRDRLEEGYECPKGYPDNLFCYRCPVGYKECRAGTHKNTFTSSYCPDCGNAEASFDPDASDQRCLSCHEREVMRRP